MSYERGYWSDHLLEPRVIASHKRADGRARKLRGGRVGVASVGHETDKNHRDKDSTC